MKKVKFNRVVLCVCMGCILVGMSVIFVIHNKLILKEPVFLRYCMETNMRYDEEALSTAETGFDSAVDFSVEFFTDRNDIRQVESVKFDQYPELEVLVFEQTGVIIGDEEFKNNKIIGQYANRILSFDIDYSKVEDLTKTIELNTATVVLSDGYKMKVDFGKIRLIPLSLSNSYDASARVFSDSITKGSYRLYMDDSIQKVALQSELFSELKDYISFNATDSLTRQEYALVANDLGEFEVPYNSGYDSVCVVQYELSEELLSLYDFYSIGGRMNMIDEDNQSVSQLLPTLQYKKSLDGNIKLIKYLRKRGAIG